MVIRSHCEACPVIRVKNESRVDRLLFSGYLLIDARRLQGNASMPGVNDQRSVLYLQFPGSVELQLSLTGIRAGSYLKVILEVPLAPVENKTNPGINILVANTGKMRHPGSPLRRIVPHKVVAFP